MNPVRTLIERIKEHYTEIANSLYRQDARVNAMLEENDRLRQRLEELRALTAIAEPGRMTDERRADR